MSTYNNNSDNTVQEDDGQWTDMEVEEDTPAQEQTETVEAEKSSPDLTLPVEQVVRTKRTSMELSQWRADMTRPEHTTNGTMKQSCLFFFPLPSFLCSFHLSFYTSFPPSVLIVCFVSRETFFLCSGFFLRLDYDF